MDKIKEQNRISQLLPAGVSPNDPNIEFVGEKDNKTVLWIQYGKTHPFTDLPSKYYTKLKEAYSNDPAAVVSLSDLNVGIRREVELYTYYIYGDLDTTPDIKDGELQPSENFRDTLDCLSLQWESKNIDFEGKIITTRQLRILDLIARDLPDKAIAHEMGIAQSTLDHHKKVLFKALNSSNKTTAMLTAVKAKIITP
ncbi:MAG: response regulator transcription factor [Flavobacteriaceae bacterium]|nr:response regulator transcription factor [Flavobacteriaceae bacterium]